MLHACLYLQAHRQIIGDLFEDLKDGTLLLSLLEVLSGLNIVSETEPFSIV